MDKNLRYHGLIQAYSRTNRIYDATKTFGNIITFRDLQQPTIDAITLFGDSNTKNVVLEKSYKEYMEGFTDVVTGEARRGFKEVVAELEQRFPNPGEIVKEKDKKEFVKLFGEYLRVENILQNFDEFANLKSLQSLDKEDPKQVEDFKAEHHLSDDDLTLLQSIKLPAERKIQDYRSTYNDIRDWLRREKAGNEKEQSNIDWTDVVFEVDLLKSQEINLDYILELIFEHNKKSKNKANLVEEVRRLIRASVGNRAKESLVVNFINQANLDAIPDKSSVIEAFFCFARAEQQREAGELIADENLNVDAAIPEPKVEHHDGRGVRSCPIFPELRPFLEEAWEAAPDGAEFVVNKPAYRAAADTGDGWKNANLRTQFIKKLTKAGVTPWARLFHSMRASRQTELDYQYPTHVVCAWLGNSPTIARKSYLLVTESDFEKAATLNDGDERRGTNPTRSDQKTAFREKKTTLQTLATSTQDSEEHPVNSLVESSIPCVFIDQISGGQGIRTLNRFPGA